MTAVRCPYCGAVVVEQTPAAAPLPRYRDVFLDQAGDVVAFRSADPHRCCGLVAAARVYAHAQAESQP